MRSESPISALTPELKVMDFARAFLYSGFPSRIMERNVCSAIQMPGCSPERSGESSGTFVVLCEVKEIRSAVIRSPVMAQ